MPHTESHHVTVAAFEGPLALLLELIQRQKLEVTTISVAAITEQYLERVTELESLEASELAEFVELGSRLLHIKSLALLPRSDNAEEASELAELAAELKDYQRYREVAASLAAGQASRLWPRGTVDPPAKLDQAAPQVSIAQLAEAFTAAIKRAAPPRPTARLAPHLALETVITALQRRLAKGAAQLQDIIDGCHDRLEMVVTFLALLELIKRGEITATQPQPFEPITLSGAAS